MWILSQIVEIVLRKKRKHLADHQLSFRSLRCFHHTVGTRYPE